MPKGLVRRHDGAPSLEGDLRQEHWIARRGECSTKHYLDPLARAKISFVEDAWPDRERDSGRKGSLNSLRIVITTQAGTLVDSHSRRKDKVILLGITIFNLCSESNLENAAGNAGKQASDTIERKRISIGVRYPLPTPCITSQSRRVARPAKTYIPSLRRKPSLASGKSSYLRLGY